jgi:hypothetical protein
VDEFPKMLYRDGTALDVNGLHVDTLIVSDDEQERDARLSGWRVGLIRHALDHDGGGHLGGSLPRKRGRPSKVLALPDIGQ